MSKAISDVSGLIDRGSKERKDLAILSGTNKPAILIEVCFVNSTVDVALYRRDFEKICQSIANVLMEHVGKSGPTDNKTDADRTSLTLLTDTGRNEIRQLLKSARKKEIISKEHTDQKINSYTDIQLLSYLSAIVNRTFK
jgi:N-acetylmuramoyl-L-alanine amidase